MHTIIIGKNHGNRSRWMRELKPMITDPRGFYTESVADPSIGGIRIYMRGIGTGTQSSDEEEFIGTCVNRHTETCVRGYEHIIPALRSILDGSSVIMDHLGSMDACCPEFQKEVLSLFDRCTVLAAVPDKVPDYLKTIPVRADTCCFNAETDELETVKQMLI